MKKLYGLDARIIQSMVRATSHMMRALINISERKWPPCAIRRRDKEVPRVRARVHPRWEIRGFLYRLPMKQRMKK